MKQEYESYVPTEREIRVVNVLVVVWSVLGLAVIVLVSVSGEWWPVIAELALSVVLVVGCTAWVARSRRQGVLTTFRQIIRTRSQRA